MSKTGRKQGMSNAVRRKGQEISLRVEHKGAMDSTRKSALHKLHIGTAN